MSSDTYMAIRSTIMQCDTQVSHAHIFTDSHTPGLQVLSQTLQAVSVQTPALYVLLKHTFQPSPVTVVCSDDQLLVGSCMGEEPAVLSVTNPPPIPSSRRTRQPQARPAPDTRGTWSVCHTRYPTLAPHRAHGAARDARYRVLATQKRMTSNPRLQYIYP